MGDSGGEGEDDDGIETGGSGVLQRANLFWECQILVGSMYIKNYLMWAGMMKPLLG